jgi:hypothetical protein
VLIESLCENFVDQRFAVHWRFAASRRQPEKWPPHAASAAWVLPFSSDRSSKYYIAMRIAVGLKFAPPKKLMASLDVISQQMEANSAWFASKKLRHDDARKCSHPRRRCRSEIFVLPIGSVAAPIRSTHYRPLLIGNCRSEIRADRQLPIGSAPHRQSDRFGV